MKTTEILLVALPPDALDVARLAARLAFPAGRIIPVDGWDEVLQGRPADGARLLVLAGAAVASVADATQVIDARGLPRWAVVVLGPGASDLVDTVPPAEWNPPLLARVFRSALLQHELLRENLSLRGDLKTVTRRVTHDLRTPIGCIYTSADMLKELEAASLAVMAGIIKQSSAEIAQIIDRVSFVLAASSDPCSSTPVRMGEVVAATLGQLETDIQKAGATVVQPASWPEVAGVGPWLQVIWWNLLSNALQHGGPTPRIQIAWRMENDGCHFSVADNGAGVLPERKACLFAPFDQLHALQAPGLGLSLVQRLVALQGGRCGYERLGHGWSAFYFTLRPVSAGS